MQESLKLHCQDEENAGSGRHGQADIFFLHRNGDESTPEVSLQYPLKLIYSEKATKFCEIFP